MKKSINLIVMSVIMFVGCSQSPKSVTTDESKDELQGVISKELADLKLAADLSKYGYANQAPLALIQAAEITAKYQNEELKVESVENETEISTDDAKDGRVEISTQVLLDDAKEMASENAPILDLIEGISGEATRGSVYGTSVIERSVSARSWVSYEVTFIKSELAEVAVSGDGDTDLDLYIYDSNGNLIAKDDDYTDDCYAAWYPKWTGNFVIKIVNRGGVRNDFILATN